jgi:hypothetical protein
MVGRAISVIICPTVTVSTGRTTTVVLSVRFRYLFDLTYTNIVSFTGMISVPKSIFLALLFDYLREQPGRLFLTVRLGKGVEYLDR